VPFTVSTYSYAERFLAFRWIRVVAWGDGVLLADASVSTVNIKFAAAGVVENLAESSRS
jgi:hypothetical protein